MINRVVTRKGRKTLMIGLSVANLDLLKEQPVNTFMEIKSAEIGFPLDVVIFSGETDRQIGALFSGKYRPPATSVVEAEDDEGRI